jgi:hypothetical protein
MSAFFEKELPILILADKRRAVSFKDLIRAIDARIFFIRPINKLCLAFARECRKLNFGSGSVPTSIPRRDAPGNQFFKPFENRSIYDEAIGRGGKRQRGPRVSPADPEISVQAFDHGV